eukprot:2476768-Lingulodinium_polyedra.AAC.1
MMQPHFVFGMLPLTVTSTIARSNHPTLAPKTNARTRRATPCARLNARGKRAAPAPPSRAPP